MADRETQQKLYAYGEMSNKVQQADRSKHRRNNRDGTGEVESLWGRNDAGRMGDKVSGGGEAAANVKTKERPVELQEKLERASKKRKQRGEGTTSLGNSGNATSGGNKESNLTFSSGGRTILEMGELSGYQPTHAGSRTSYESLLVSATHDCYTRP